LATAAASQDVVFREIRPDDSVSGLSLGDAEFAPLKAFLRKCARRYHKECLAKTYVYATTDVPARVVAYVSLICSQIEVDGGLPAVEDYQYKDVPAVKVARLAVDHRYRGNQLGKKLVSVAIALAKEQVMPHVGCRFLVVDSKSGSVEFYKKRGFILLDTENNKRRPSPVMFLDLWKLP
jgi:GNAT superfamily N-acetyltransferase